MKMKGSNFELSHRYGVGWFASFQVDLGYGDTAKTVCDEFKQSDIEVNVSKWKERRSLDANAYAWVLIGKIAEATRTDKTAVYQHAIREIGGNYKVGCFQDADVSGLVDCWQSNGIGWIADTMPSKIAGCTNVILYYGSHIYDTQQMSRLIDYLVSEAKELGVEYLPPDEIERMLTAWH